MAGKGEGLIYWVKREVEGRVCTLYVYIKNVKKTIGWEVGLG